MATNSNPKPYALLRGAYIAAGYDQVTLAQKMGRCETYINQHFGGKLPWDQTDMYKLMDILRIPYEEMHRYFPPRGIPSKAKQVNEARGPRRLVIAP